MNECKNQTNINTRYYRIVQTGPNKYMARDDTWSNVLGKFKK